MSSATERHSVTCTFGRTRVETVPARPVEIAWVASERRGEPLQRQRGGQARPRPSVLACHSLDDRSPAHVESAPARAGGPPRAPSAPASARCPRRRRPRRSPRRGSRMRRCPAGSARCGRRTGRWPSSGRGPAGRRASARSPARPARSSGRAGQRMLRRRDDDQPAAQERHRGDRIRALGARVRAERDVRAADAPARSANDAPGGRFDRDLDARRRGP